MSRESVRAALKSARPACQFRRVTKAGRDMGACGWSEAMHSPGGYRPKGPHEFTYVRENDRTQATAMLALLAVADAAAELLEQDPYTAYTEPSYADAEERLQAALAALEALP